MSADPHRPSRRTWPQRLVFAAVLLGAVACFVAAAGVWFAQYQLGQRNLVAIDDGSSAIEATGDASALDLDGVSDASDGSVGDDEPVATDAPVETFPAAEPAARNILITGADNNSCIDPSSPYYAAFGDREGLGERSDTIMMWRVNPSTSQVAVLSFPRDLWVTIDGRSSPNRINAAYVRDDPQRLINTIANNFGILTDHFIQVDFCAFKTLVDALDGVSVPFDRPVRDVNTGLKVDVAEPSCFEFDGDHALAYVRSRKLQVYTEEGTWETDPTSDLGRISRQQDFIRRVISEALDNRFSPSVIRGLLETNDEYIVTDTGLTVDKILQLAGVLQNVDPSQITTYQVEATGKVIQGNAVLVPRLEGENMQAILALFRGAATLADAPEQVFAEDTTSTPDTTVPLVTTTTTTVAGADEAGDSGASGGGDDDPGDVGPATTEAELEPFETLPEVEAEDITYGFVPDEDIQC